MTIGNSKIYTTTYQQFLMFSFQYHFSLFVKAAPVASATHIPSSRSSSRTIRSPLTESSWPLQLHLLLSPKVTSTFYFYCSISSLQYKIYSCYYGYIPNYLKTYWHKTINYCAHRVTRRHSRDGLSLLQDFLDVRRKTQRLGIELSEVKLGLLAGTPTHGFST